MAEDHNLSRVRLGALVLMLGVGAEMLRYTYRSFERALNFCFWKPEHWNTHYLMDADIVVEMGPRIIYFSAWGTIILLSVLAFLASLYLLSHVWRGQIFELQAAKAMTWLGLVLGIAMVADLIFHAADHWLLTLPNAEPLGIRWGYDPSDIKTLVMAAVLFLFGWVVRQSIEIDRENREFV